LPSRVDDHAAVEQGSEQMDSVCPEEQVLDLPPCGHTRGWKRLRCRKGVTHLICSRCGARWKTALRLAAFKPYLAK
jgi:predicted RNA-binding Zn-ribbon protein involved in translation (DUF1610 family)